MSYSEQNSGPASDRLVITSPEDVLAFANHTLLHEPVDSCIMLSLHADGTFGAAVRCDLPDPAEAFLTTDDDRRRFRWMGALSAEVLRSDTQATGALIIYKNDRTDTNIEMTVAGCRHFDEFFRAGVHTQGLSVYESWLMMNDRVWHIHCTHGEGTPEGACPVQGVSHSSPHTSFVDATFRIRGSALRPAPAQRRNVLDGRTLAPRYVLTETLPEDLDLVPSALSVIEWFNHWEPVLDGSHSLTLSPEVVATLTRPLLHKGLRDGLVSLACFGVYRALSALAHLRLIDPTDAETAGIHAEAEHAELMGASLLGSSTQGPEWNRIACLERAVLALIPEAGDDETVVLMTLLIWIEWIRGRASYASSYYEQLSAAGGGAYHLAALFRQAMQAGLVCEWAKNRDLAWSATAHREAA